MFFAQYVSVVEKFSQYPSDGNNALFRQATENGVHNWSLDKFAQTYTVFGSRANQKGKIKKMDKNTFVQFTPAYSNNPSATNYVEYCRLALIRYKTWNDVYGGQDATDQEIKGSLKKRKKLWKVCPKYDYI